MAAPLIEESIDIDATPEQVWEVISDLKRMGEWSPQCVKMIVRGPVGLGTKTINVNRHGPLVWPTTSKIVRFSPNQELGFRVAENRTVWSFQLEPTADGGTLVTHRRETPHGISAISKAMTAVALGGPDAFVAELLEGMSRTLERVKAELEG